MALASELPERLGAQIYTCCHPDVNPPISLLSCLEGTLLKSNQKVSDYSHNSYVIIIPMDTFCLADQ